MSCINQQPLADPPVSESSGYQLVVINAEGETVLLSRPANKSILVFDGNNIYFADGTDSRQINLPELKEFNSTFTGLVVLDNGRMKSLVNETSNAEVPSCINGVWSMVASQTGLPATGTGLLRRSTIGIVDYLSTRGTPYIDLNGNVGTVSDDAAGKIYTIKADGTPGWMPPLSGNIASGAGTTGLETVRANSTNNTVVNIVIPSFTVSDGTLTKTYSNVNVTVDITAGVGPGGLETGGSETADTWYYVYIIADGTNPPDAVISTDPSVPDLSDVSFTGGGLTYYGFASVFRNNSSSNIVQYYQKGRKFWIDVSWGLMLNGGNVSTSFAAVPEGGSGGAIALSKIVPPMVTSIDGFVSGSSSVNGYNLTGWDGATLGTAGLGVGTQFIRDFGDNGTGPFYGLPIFNPSSPRIAHKANVAKVDRVLRIESYEI